MKAFFRHQQCTRLNTSIKATFISIAFSNKDSVILEMISTFPYPFFPVFPNSINDKPSSRYLNLMPMSHS